MDVQRILATIAEPTRFRIVRLLAARPQTVGEIAAALGALQPQTTKHLQAMEAAGVVTVHRLGRRRVVSLRRDALEHVTETLSAIAAVVPEAGDLAAYEQSIAAEEGRWAAGESSGRVIRLRRDLPAPPSSVWRAWTTPELVRRWWAPEHFEVADCEVSAQTGSPMRIVLREGDGAEYVAAGRILGALRDREFRFELAPLDGSGEPLFRAVYAVAFAGGADTALTVEIRVSDVRQEAAPAVAGLEIGWAQLLDRLEELVG